MRRHWQLITVEIILGILIELAPASLDMWATVAEYLVKLSGEKVSIQALFFSVEQRWEHKFILNSNKFNAPSLVA